MTLSLVLELSLAVLIVAAAAWCVFAKRSFAASVAFVSLGLLLTIVWVQLGAPDVALTEAALGSGLTGVLLLGASAWLRDSPAEYAAPTGAGRRFLAAVACTAVSAGLAYAVLNPAEPAPTLAPAALASLPQLQLGNPVTGVLMGFRAIDTLLQARLMMRSIGALAPSDSSAEFHATAAGKSFDMLWFTGSSTRSRTRGTAGRVPRAAGPRQ